MRRRLQHRGSSGGLIDAILGMASSFQGLSQLITYKFTKLQKFLKNFLITTIIIIIIITMTTPMIITPPTPMHDNEGSTQPPVLSNDETSQGPPPPPPLVAPVVVAPVVVNLTDEIKLGMLEVVRKVNLRVEVDMAKAFGEFASVIKPEAKACATAVRGDASDATMDLRTHADKMTRALELLVLTFESCLNDKVRAKLALESLSNPKPVVIPEVLPFEILGQTSPTSNNLPSGRSMFDVNSKLATRFTDSSQGSVFTTTTIKQRKRKRQANRQASSNNPVKPKKARANPLWTPKEIKQLTVRVYKYAVNVLNHYPSLTPGQLAERISLRISKGDYVRSPTAVTKKMRNLGLVLTHPKNPDLIKFLTRNNLMQFVPKRFQPDSSSPSSSSSSDDSMHTVPSKSAADVVIIPDDKCYTDKEIASVESKEPTTTTTTALASLIASIPPVPVST